MRDKLVVHCAYGKLRGETNDDIRVWKGIPYAGPPVGEARYRPPRKPGTPMASTPS